MGLSARGLGVRVAVLQGGCLARVRELAMRSALGSRSLPGGSFS